MSKSGGGAPTGCYKCGRPGHWSRDCTSNPNSSGTSDANGKAPIQAHNTEFNSNARAKPPLPTGKQKQRNSRPKLTPDLLLSDAGVGHILRYFPKAFKYHGRGQEVVNDLRRLLSMYAEWHSRLMPYYNFDQFIHKVEKVGSTKRVKVCLGQLRDKVSHGADPTELHGSQVQQNSDNGHDGIEALDALNHSHENNWQNEDVCNLVEGMAVEISEETTKDTCDVPDKSSAPGESSGSIAYQKQISDEQKARMEANKLKALERAAARSRH